MVGLKLSISHMMRNETRLNCFQILSNFLLSPFMLVARIVRINLQNLHIFVSSQYALGGLCRVIYKIYNISNFVRL